ncbi:hypothetical protein MTR67_039858 [Solanum verrucosum]|uniref:Integrase zinc-binding domain-containing protein n=1 Tax=Solanum verrucosum TaxID=315347 RepID=A0AAF0ZQU5_SOLVR|nr:hypothetical protein MTR67_039858 [Solanum verrucosum]
MMLVLYRKAPPLLAFGLIQAGTLIDTPARIQFGYSRGLVPTVLVSLLEAIVDTIFWVFFSVVFSIKIWRHYLYGVHVEVVTDHKSLHVAHVKEGKKELLKDVHRVARLGVCLTDTSYGGVIVHNGSESSLVAEVKEKQDSDPILLHLKGAVHQQKVEVFSQGGYGVLHYQGHLCVPNVGGLRQKILTEANNSRYSIHQGATKMYRDLREVFWWSGMKRDIADFLAKCPNCQ